MEMKLRKGLASKITVPTGMPEVLVFDSKQRGFFLRKYASGETDYGVLCTANGKRRKVMLGRDASVKGNLAKARQEAEDVRAKARIDGRDVLHDRLAAAAAAAKAVTVLDAAMRYVEARQGDWRPRYRVEVERLLIGTVGNGRGHTVSAFKSIYGRDVGQVSRADVVAAIDKVATERGPVEADHARTALSGLYTWLIDRGTVDASPVLKIKSKATGGGRERTLTAAELRTIWKGTEYVCADYRRIIRLLMLTGSRREEIGGLQWSEVRGDRIELPGSRVKNARDHLIPLSPLAIRQLPARKDRSNVFGRRRGKTFSGWGKAKQQLDSHAILDHWTPHDLRRTVATMLRELRIADTHLVELILNHTSGTRSGLLGFMIGASGWGNGSKR